ncbi:endonuclease/exonuclease/phosphatase [Mycobacterium sp. 1164966.3]|nr:endonuclease/exonuclease/phosphatase [Mycobacterium sp. 1164966.3]
MKRLGYQFIATSNPETSRNGVLVASKWPFEDATERVTPDVDRERWLAVRLNELDLDRLLVHIPGTQDHRFSNDRAISGARRKQLLWERAIKYAVDHRGCRAIILGDFNTGLRIDAEGEMFAMSHYMTQLADIGFVDTWRHLHTHVRDYTWYSKRKDQTTGKSVDFNGFRVDYIFVSPQLQHAIADAAILHEPRQNGASDHASVVADINIAVPTKITGIDSSTCGQIGDTVGPEGRLARAEIGPKGNVRARFELAPGSLSDMTNGLNGQDAVQQFRPTFVTAEWAGGVLKEVRIWGPRLLQNGSLGKRLLDHVWKRSVAVGGVNYDELPTLVAAQLLSYTTANSFEDLPE